MKFSAAAFDAFVRRPDPKLRALLLYGPDRGLVGERWAAIAGTADDPFGGPIELSAAAVVADPARLVDEATSLSFAGTPRPVRLRDATDAVAPVVEGYLGVAPPGALVVVEAGELAPRSALRRLFEGAKTAAAVACYLDDAEGVAGIVRETLAARGLGVSAEAVAFLTENLGGDRAVTRGELEKLALYMGAGGGTVGIDEARAVVGDSAQISLEEVALAAASGDARALERAVARAVAEGVGAVGLLRAAGRHLQRLHLAAGLVARGRPPAEAMKAMRPPVFFRHQKAFADQLRLWTGPALATALGWLTEAEIACKETGTPETLVSSEALARICRLAARGG